MFRTLLEACRAAGNSNGASQVQAAVKRLHLIADASVAMGAATTVLIMATCLPLLVLLVWAVIDPQAVDAWADSSSFMAKLQAQAQAVHGLNQNPAANGGWRVLALLKTAPTAAAFRRTERFESAVALTFL